MDLKTYQRKAKRTDQRYVKEQADPAKIVPLLGLAGETGQLLAEYKKYLRDGEAHRAFPEKVAEELGDLLWYLSTVATKFDLKLEDIAQQNLEKCKSRWDVTTDYQYLDDDYPVKERFERSMTVELIEVDENEKIKTKAFINGKRVGDDLTDNAYRDDGYRFHDVFHLAYVAVLGWSPVMRGLLGRKRKSNSQDDEVQDGGRAIAIEEGITALVFNVAEKHRFFVGIKTLDFSLLKTILGMVAQLEVSERTYNDWQRAILLGYEVWRQVRKRKHVMLKLDMKKRTMTVVGDASAKSRKEASIPTAKKKSAPKRR